MKISIGEAIRSERKRRGWSQKQVQSLVQIDRRRLSDLELGKRVPSAEESRLLSEIGLLQKANAPRRPTNLQLSSSWLERPLQYRPKPSRPVKVRIAAALKRYGSWINLLVSRLGHGSYRREREEFLNQACVESGTELAFWLELLTLGSRPCRLPPCRTGFRTLPVLHPTTLSVQSDARHPCLEGQLDGLEFLAFPQLTVLARGRVYRLDSLFGFKVGKTKVWLNVEIDGAGHDVHRDLERERDLGLLAVRITDRDLQARLAMSTLRSKIGEFTGVLSAAEQLRPAS